MKPVLEKMRAIRKDHPDLPTSDQVSKDYEAAYERFTAAAKRMNNLSARLALQHALADVLGAHD